LLGCLVLKPNLKVGVKLHLCFQSQKLLREF
jgi:hypothetical protein